MSEVILEILDDVVKAYEVATNKYADVLNSFFARQKLRVRIRCVEGSIPYGTARYQLETKLTQLQAHVRRMPLARAVPLWRLCAYRVSLSDDFVALVDLLDSLGPWSVKRVKAEVIRPFEESVKSTHDWLLNLRQKNTESIDRSKHTIPPKKRTVPMSYRRAAKLMGKGESKDAAEWLSNSVKDGSIPCEHITRQTHIFSLDSFPASVWKRILPA